MKDKFIIVDKDVKEVFRLFPTYYELSIGKKQKILSKLMEWIEMEINALDIKIKKKPL